MEKDVAEAVSDMQAENENEEEKLVLDVNGVYLLAGCEEVNAKGVRVLHAGEGEDSEPEYKPQVKVSRKQFAKNCNILEARYLS